MERRHIWVEGKVQGVWYRGACARQAAALGLAGWAKNLADGRVEVVAEGEAGALDKLVEWCREGPPDAQVSSLKLLAEEADGLTGFEVR